MLREDAAKLADVYRKRQSAQSGLQKMQADFGALANGRAGFIIGVALCLNLGEKVLSLLYLRAYERHCYRANPHSPLSTVLAANVGY